MRSVDKSYEIVVEMMHRIQRIHGNKYKLDIGKFHKYLPSRKGLQLQITMGFFARTRVAVIYVEELGPWLSPKARPKRKPEIDVKLDRRFHFIEDSLKEVVTIVNREVSQRFHLDYAVSF